MAALGPAVQAMLHGHKLLINEINMLPPDLVSALTQAMDTGRLVISGTDLGNIEIEVHEQFGVFATANPNYVGAAEIGRALQRRFGWGLGAIPMGFLPPDEEADAVAYEFGRLELAEALDLRANPSIVERLVGVAGQLRGHAELGGGHAGPDFDALSGSLAGAGARHRAAAGGDWGRRPCSQSRRTT